MEDATSVGKDEGDSNEFTQVTRSVYLVTRDRIKYGGKVVEVVQEDGSYGEKRLPENRGLSRRLKNGKDTEREN